MYRETVYRRDLKIQSQAALLRNVRQKARKKVLENDCRRRVSEVADGGFVVDVEDVEGVEDADGEYAEKPEKESGKPRKKGKPRQHKPRPVAC